MCCFCVVIFFSWIAFAEWKDDIVLWIKLKTTPGWMWLSHQHTEKYPFPAVFFTQFNSYITIHIDIDSCLPHLAAMHLFYRFQQRQLSQNQTNEKKLFENRSSSEAYVLHIFHITCLHLPFSIFPAFGHNSIYEFKTKTELIYLCNPLTILITLPTKPSSCLCLYYRQYILFPSMQYNFIIIVNRSNQY